MYPYDCMQVYDVTNSTDTQRNLHLDEHHILDIKSLHGYQSLHNTRQGKMTDSTTTDLQSHIPITRLVEFRVARFFIKSKRCVLSLSVRMQTIVIRL